MRVLREHGLESVEQYNNQEDYLHNADTEKRWPVLAIGNFAFLPNAWREHHYSISRPCVHLSRVDHQTVIFFSENNVQDAYTRCSRIGYVHVQPKALEIVLGYKTKYSQREESDFFNVLTSDGSRQRMQRAAIRKLKFRSNTAKTKLHVQYALGSWIENAELTFHRSVCIATRNNAGSEWAFSRTSGDAPSYLGTGNGTYTPKVREQSCTPNFFMFHLMPWLVKSFWLQHPDFSRKESRKS